MAIKKFDVREPKSIILHPDQEFWSAFELGRRAASERLGDDISCAAFARSLIVKALGQSRHKAKPPKTESPKTESPEPT